ncbi:MAG: hypothetical protein QOC70_1575 [Verrucomicrobiota bacterium]|jgi:hypothetical protein
MKPGIFHVTFSSPATHLSGEGLAVIKSGTINGGDLGYLYSGTFIQADSSVSSSLTIKQWNAKVTGIFGPLKEFALTLTGTVSDDRNSFAVTGSVVENPQTTISINGRRLADAK